MFNFQDGIMNRLARGRREVMTDKQFIEREISRFKGSRRRREMFTGLRYYEGRHDILAKKRTVIGAGGEVTEVKNLPNNRIIDNQYRKMVNQKANYLLGKPITIRADNKAYSDALGALMGRRFMRMMKNVAKTALNEGIAWIFPTYDDNGEFIFRKFPGHEIIPGWADADHTRLEYAIRLYAVVSYEGEEERIVEKAEVFDESGVHYFVLEGQSLVPEEPYHQSYFTIDDAAANWSKIPLIPFKRDDGETPLIRCVKSLQDGMNTILSSFQDNMEEDARNTILVLVNYDGQNLGEFRRNLAQYGAVKVKTVDGAAGDLRTLQVEVNADNYKAILDLFKKAIVENAMGYDAKDERMSGTPNQMNIQSMYCDIDLDAGEMETEFQAAMEELLWFVGCHFANAGIGDFEGEAVEIIFNRDILINENEVIENIGRSVGVLSEETLIAQHPWVSDVNEEMKRLKRQRAQELDGDYLTTFRRKAGGGDGSEGE